MAMEAASNLVSLFSFKRLVQFITFFITLSKWLFTVNTSEITVDSGRCQDHVLFVQIYVDIASACNIHNTNAAYSEDSSSH